MAFIGPCLVGKDIVFRFITESSSLRDLGTWVVVGLFLYKDFFEDDISTCVRTRD
jgi:hypothetical protein